MKKNEFAILGVNESLSEALLKFGYTEPTPIQKEAIPAVLAGSDLIAQAQTGTGKTLAFVLPILETIDASKSHVQALIVTPTRELAIQITEEVQRWAPLQGLNVLSAYGGQDVERQVRKLEGSIHIIVATPGRLLDHIRRETVALHKLSVLVLDEADQMLHMGFLPEVEEIISVTPSRRQTLLFSATMPQRIRDLAKAYMRKPLEIEVKAKRVTLDGIQQLVIQTTDRGKLDTLCKIIDEENPYLAMIFCRTKLRAGKLRAELAERGYSCDELHGDLTQAKREQVMKRFRDAKIQLLIATDLAARGLDVEGITHVVNYDIPHDAENYIHRIGRTGRAGQTGKAITLASPHDTEHVALIERGIKATLSKQRSGRPVQQNDVPERPAARDRSEGDGRGSRTAARSGGSRRDSVRGGRRGEAPAGGRGRRGGERNASAGRSGNAASPGRGGQAQGPRFTADRETVSFTQLRPRGSAGSGRAERPAPRDNDEQGSGSRFGSPRGGDGSAQQSRRGGQAPSRGRGAQGAAPRSGSPRSGEGFAQQGGRAGQGSSRGRDAQGAGSRFGSPRSGDGFAQQGGRAGQDRSAGKGGRSQQGANRGSSPGGKRQGRTPGGRRGR
ncbi:DEAD/DEAH box helicase [Paenibacillus filicis]|uniref:DEAD/DEAH box helicase n=1 Tax=Paenibacillus filicis TaxID=669464 RepID=A0ABU9DQL9_9BACL